MNKLKKFEDFINEKLSDLILENIDSDTLLFVIKDNLKMLLDKIDHVIAEDILNVEKNKEESDVTLVDIGDSNDKVTLTYSNKVMSIISSNSYIPSPKYYFNKNIDYFKNNITSHRVPMKVGKLVRKLFGDKYKESGDPGNDIQSFVNKYKSAYTLNFGEDGKGLFEIVNGDDIIKWYDYENYAETTKDTVLHNSCMADSNCGDYIEFYSKNPDKVRMLIQFKDSNKDSITARALIWKLDSPEGRYFMDRIYYVDEYQIDSFIDYAKKEEWLYKKEQDSGSFGIIDSLTGEKVIETLKVYNINLHKYYPYLDTLKYLYQDNKILSNYKLPLIKDEDPVILNSASGGVDYGEWSDYYKKYISTLTDNFYVHCKMFVKDKYDYGNNFRKKEDAVYLEYYNNWAPKEEVKKKIKSGDLIKTEYGQRYLVLKEDAYWLSHYNAYTTVNYANLNMLYSEFYEDFVDRKDFVKAYDGDYIFLSKAVSVYRSKEDALSQNNITFVPKEILDEKTYKFGDKYILKEK